MLEKKDLQAIKAIVKETVKDIVDPQFQHVNELIELNARAIQENREAIEVNRVAVEQNHEAIEGNREGIDENRATIKSNREAIHELANHMDRRFNEFQAVMASKEYVNQRISRLRLQT